MCWTSLAWSSNPAIPVRENLSHYCFQGSHSKNITSCWIKLDSLRSFIGAKIHSAQLSSTPFWPEQASSTSQTPILGHTKLPFKLHRGYLLRPVCNGAIVKQWYKARATEYNKLEKIQQSLKTVRLEVYRKRLVRRTAVGTLQCAVTQYRWWLSWIAPFPCWWF